MTELPHRQQIFVEAYLATRNATKAAIRAGYSEKTAYSQGQRLLKNAEIQARVGERVEQEAMSASEVLKELASIAKGDYADYKGDKIRSLELLGKYHKLFTDKVETNTATLDPFIATLSKWVDDHKRAGITLPAEEIADEAERLAKANNVPPEKLIDAVSELVQ